MGWKISEASSRSLSLIARSLREVSRECMIEYLSVPLFIICSLAAFQFEKNCFLFFSAYVEYLRSVELIRKHFWKHISRFISLRAARFCFFFGNNVAKRLKGEKLWRSGESGRKVCDDQPWVIAISLIFSHCKMRFYLSFIKEKSKSELNWHHLNFPSLRKDSRNCIFRQKVDASEDELSRARFSSHER